MIKAVPLKSYIILVSGNLFPDLTSYEWVMIKIHLICVPLIYKFQHVHIITKFLLLASFYLLLDLDSPPKWFSSFPLKHYELWNCQVCYFVNKTTIKWWRKRGSMLLMCIRRQHSEIHQCLKKGEGERKKWEYNRGRELDQSTMHSCMELAQWNTLILMEACSKIKENFKKSLKIPKSFLKILKLGNRSGSFWFQEGKLQPPESMFYYK
jgi:hypothetical protein